VEQGKILSQSNKLSIQKLNKSNACEFRKAFDFIYQRYNHFDYISPDPLQFLYDYKSIQDREIVALIASSLAYGRVCQIIKSIEFVLDKMDNAPYHFIMENSEKGFITSLKGFKHRFTDALQLSKLLLNAKSAIKKFGSLEMAFSNFFTNTKSYIWTIENFAILLNGNSQKANYLIPRPSNGSPCKRLNLMIKWLVRQDEIDPGGWKLIPKSELIIPLDTHMWQISYYLGFTKRKNPDFKAAIEITNAFKKINPEDPCKYDFSLTRLGIRNTKDFRGSIIK